MSQKIQHRRGTAAAWTSANPVLAAGEEGFETDTGLGKVGDGTTAWASLLYTYGNSIPNPAFISGRYYHAGYISVPTTLLLAEGVLRVAPFIITKPVTISRLAAEVTTVGSAGSVLRLGILNNVTNDFYPGTVALDAGTIDGTSATVQEITVNTTLTRGVYWFGGAAQGAPATACTVRVLANGIFPLATGTALPAANAAAAGYSMTGVTGALPTFSSTITIITNSPRLIFKVA